MDTIKGKFKEVETLITQLTLQQETITKKDIASWRKDHQMAINFENPKRVGLHSLYDFIVSIDSHVEGVVERTKLGIMQKKFRLVDKNGKEITEKTNLLESDWFKIFMDLALEAHYYGHSLIEIRNQILIGDKPAFANVSIIPRNHVCPEYGVLLKEISDEPKNGIPYRGVWPNMLIEVGQPKALGKFLKICPQAISKKNAQIFWDDFSERFGIPIIVASMKTRDVEQQKKVSAQLKGLGSKATLVINDDVTFEKIETSKGDAYMVFDQRILRAEEQISIALAGQTMVFSNGASKAQGEVHEKGFAEVKFALADRLKDVINDQLLPLLILNGFPVEGLRFEWNDAYEFSPEETAKAEALALQYYEVDPKYFVDKYGIPITGVKKQEQPNFSLNDFFA